MHCLALFRFNFLSNERSAVVRVRPSLGAPTAYVYSALGIASAEAMFSWPTFMRANRWDPEAIEFRARQGRNSRPLGARRGLKA